MNTIKARVVLLFARRAAGLDPPLAASAFPALELAIPARERERGSPASLARILVDSYSAAVSATGGTMFACLYRKDLG